MPAVPADFFVPHALEAYRLMGAPGEEGDAEIVVNAFKAAQVREMTKRELNRATRTRIAPMSRLNGAISFLEEKAWLRSETSHIVGRPTTLLTLNPKIIL